MSVTEKKVYEITLTGAQLATVQALVALLNYNERIGDLGDAIEYDTGHAPSIKNDDEEEVEMGTLEVSFD